MIFLISVLLNLGSCAWAQDNPILGQANTAAAQGQAAAQTPSTEAAAQTAGASFEGSTPTAPPASNPTNPLGARPATPPLSTDGWTPGLDEGPPPAALKPSPPPEGGFMAGFKSLLHWDDRTMPAFAIGLVLGLGVAVATGLLFAAPPAGIAVALCVGLTLGFFLNAFK